MNILTKVTVIDYLVPGAKFDVDPVTEEIVWLDDRPMPSEDEIEAGYIEYVRKTKIDELKSRIDKLADEKTDEAKYIVTGKRLTRGQLLRYEYKYDLAKTYKATNKFSEILAIEANMSGLTVDELADLIIKTGDEYRANMYLFVEVIETLRIFLNKKTEEGEFDKVSSVIAEVYKLPISEITQEKLTELLTNVGLLEKTT